MIKVNVLSEEKSWSKKIKKKENFSIMYVKIFQKSLDILTKSYI